MPIYEYFCFKCELEFELKRPLSDAGEPAPCPQCGSLAQKLVSGFGSKTGFYIRATKKTFRGRPEKKEGS